MSEDLFHADSGDNRSSEKSGQRSNMWLCFMLGTWTQIFLSSSITFRNEGHNLAALAGVLLSLLIFISSYAFIMSGDRTDDAKQKVSE